MQPNTGACILNRMKIGSALWINENEGVKAMQTGLVLEGGGTRGSYTAGVLDVFMEIGRAHV